ncbi:MAG: hypothetical protein ACRD2L_20450, partial [Terriglobia bacterium]
MAKIYIASFFNTRTRLLPVCEKLEAGGHEIVSTWIRKEASEKITYAGSSEEYLLDCARRDVADIEKCEVFILDTQDETPRGGREVELGFALAKGKP